jgi:hypothetical protein
VQTGFETTSMNSRTPSAAQHAQLVAALTNINLFKPDSCLQGIVDVALRTVGSLEVMQSVSDEFFRSTHQRISAVSRLRFNGELLGLFINGKADFATLCMSIFMIQEMPGDMVSSSSLYYVVKHFVNVLEASTRPTMNLLQSRILVSFYEMGHGMNAAAYLSIAAAARLARLLGAHSNQADLRAEQDIMAVEEQRRAWWAIFIMDRFINLCNGDALFASADASPASVLPTEDIIWSEATSPSDVSATSNPTLSTPADITVGQMARECQIAYLAGRVVRHVFEPVNDHDFRVQEAAQLERTLGAYIPLLTEEALRIGRFCGALGIANRFVVSTEYPQRHC